MKNNFILGDTILHNLIKNKMKTKIDVKDIIKTIIPLFDPLIVNNQKQTTLHYVAQYEPEIFTYDWPQLDKTINMQDCNGYLIIL